MSEASEIQARYYTDTASRYDTMHVTENIDPEHEVAFSFMCSMIDHFNVFSILDVGAGTGRVIMKLQKRFPLMPIAGIEPVAALREEAYAKGVSKKLLLDGNGRHIEFANDQFDMVCAYGVLHHVDEPAVVIEEMLRVAKKAIFISDSNNFGQGGRLPRFTKQLINSLGLWSAFNYVRTAGKKYQISEGDGLFYSYSLFNNFSLIKKQCKSVHVLNTRDAGVNPYRTATHAAILGIKK
jgi:ubiquinone/menaquinone biosynthesis C-methylase UbiE